MITKKTLRFLGLAALALAILAGVGITAANAQFWPPPPVFPGMGPPPPPFPPMGPHPPMGPPFLGPPI